MKPPFSNSSGVVWTGPKIKFNCSQHCDNVEILFCYNCYFSGGEGGGGGGAARKRYAKKSLVSTQQNCELTDTGDKTAVGNYHKNVKENSL